MQDHQRIAEQTAIAAEEGHDLTAPVTVTIAHGTAGWSVPDPSRPGQVLAMHAPPGETVTMPLSQAIRNAALGYVHGVKPDEAARVMDAPTMADEETEDLAALDDPPAVGLDRFLDDLVDETAGDTDPDDEPGATSPLDDETIAAKSAPQLAAHLNEFPGDSDRVLALELARKPSSQRVTVLRLVGAAPDED